MNLNKIKFRVFNKAANRWYYYEIPEDLYRNWSMNFNEDFDWNTMGRFSDHLDKLGNEIYEGDLIKYELGDGKGEVIYTSGQFLVSADGNYWHYLNSVMDYLPEVIGNIHRDF